MATLATANILVKKATKKNKDFPKKKRKFTENVRIMKTIEKLATYTHTHCHMHTNLFMFMCHISKKKKKKIKKNKEKKKHVI